MNNDLEEAVRLSEAEGFFVLKDTVFGDDIVVVSKRWGLKKALALHPGKVVWGLTELVRLRDLTPEGVQWIHLAKKGFGGFIVSEEFK